MRVELARSYRAFRTDTFVFHAITQENESEARLFAEEVVLRIKEILAER